ncbi:MAG: NAD(+) synthase [Alphaproteobacteria bacterium]|nr:NAD(+) synthase [Alphaproteobacteria bacterium]
MQNLWHRLQNGLIDYCQKNGFQKVIIGLSGGLDSAITAVLAADTLGGKNVSALMMKTQYTSDLSLQIARQVAQLNQLNYQELDIESLVQSQINFLNKSLNEPLKNVVIENIQARLRGQILMAYSNQNGGLVLACGNKSEIFTGYCTLYGDTCGGLAPLGNVYKSTIFGLAQWRNRLNPVLPAEVITRAPSAELAYNQKDEHSLPPYSILDDILRLMIDQHLSLADIVAAGFDERTVSFVHDLVKRSAFKRQQMAESIKV